MPTKSSLRPTRSRFIALGCGLLLLILMGLNTKVLTPEEAAEAQSGSFSPSSYAAENFETAIAPAIIDQANDLAPVSQAIEDDPAAAAKEFSVVTGSSAPVYSVNFTGTAGEVTGGGQLPVTVDGVPAGINVYVQMGPAINGTAIRDATGLVDFAAFKNQIEYQNVGAELNNQVKEKVLTGIDASTLDGQEVTVTGAFQLINPEAIIVTPVQFEAAP